MDIRQQASMNNQITAEGRDRQADNRLQHLSYSEFMQEISRSCFILDRRGIKKMMSF